MSAIIKTAAAAGIAAAAALGATSAETRSFDIDGFTAVDASAGTDVIIKVGGGYSIVAEGEDRALERLRIEKRGDTLEIGRANHGIVIGHSRRVVVTVTMPVLNAVDVSSGADLEASGIDADNFDASVSSGADATLSGRCGALTADGNSGADLDAGDLKCARARADVSSGADLTIYASQSITASASSGGDVTVLGNPDNRDVDRSSGGDVDFVK